MRRFLLGFLALGGLAACAQTYGPGELYYGGIHLQFSGQVQVMGACSGPYQLSPGVSEVRCEAQAGTSGRILFTATRTPAGPVNIRAEALPSGWSAFSVASGWGTVTALYPFTVPSTPGQSYLLRFKAWAAGVVGELEFRLSLTVRATPSEPEPLPSYGPFTGTTDASGRFEIPVPILPNVYVTGTLTECTMRVLPQAQVAVTLVPRSGVTTIVRADQIGAVRVSSPGYSEAIVTQLQLLSAMDMFGRVSTTVGVGTVCLRPTAPTLTPTASIQSRTDSEGKFSVPLPWPGATVIGKLTICTITPIPNMDFTLTLVPRDEVLSGPEDIAGFMFNAPGYKPATVTQFSKLSFFGLTWYDTGPVCLLTEASCEGIPLRILTQNTKRLTHGDPTLPAREADVFALLRSPIEYNFDIVCLQEWFQDAGPWGALGFTSWSTQKGPLLRHWLDAEPDLTERTVENAAVGNVNIVDARPNDLPCEIVVGENYVAGPDAAWFLETRIDGGLLILVRPGLKIIRASAFVLRESAGWDSYASKGALYARVQLDPNNPACFIHVFNTHLQAGDAPSDQNIRAHQLSELIRFIDRCTSDDRAQNQVQHPMLLCGDFNIAGGSQEWKNHLQSLGAAGVALEDLWLKAGNKEGKDGATWVGNDQDTTGTPWDAPEGRKEGNVLATEGGAFQRLDYIFFWPGLQPLQLALLSVAREPENPRVPPYHWG